MVKDIFYSEDPELIVIDTRGEYQRTSESQQFALAELKEKLLDKPMRFKITGDYEIEETTQVLSNLHEDLLNFGTTRDFYRFLLGPMFHLKDKQLPVNVPIVDWLEYEDERIDHSTADITGDSQYRLVQETNENVVLSYSGDSTIDTDIVSGTVSINGTARIQSDNGMIQNRQHTITVDAYYPLETHQNFFLYEEWIPLK